MPEPIDHELVPQLEGQRPVRAVAWSPDGATIAALHRVQRHVPGETTAEDNIRLWDAKSGRLRQTIRARRRGKKDSYDNYDKILWSSDGERLAVASMRQIDLYRSSGRFERTVESRSKYPTPQDMDFSRDGRRLAVIGGDKGTVRIYDPNLGIVAEHPGSVGRLTAIAFGPKRKHIALGGITQLSVLDVQTGQVKALFKGNFSGPREIVWLDDKIFHTANRDGVVMRFELAGGEPKAYKTHTGHVRRLALSADAQALATADNHGELKLWRAANLEPLASHSFRGHEVQSLAWHPSAPILALAFGPLRLLRPKDGTWVDLHLVPVGRGKEHGGIAVASSGLFNGDEQAFRHVRWRKKGQGQAGTLRWYDAFPAYRRRTVVADLIRGCPLGPPLGASY